MLVTIRKVQGKDTNKAIYNNVDDNESLFNLDAIKTAMRHLDHWAVFANGTHQL